MSKEENPIKTVKAWHSLWKGIPQEYYDKVMELVDKSTPPSMRQPPDKFLWSKAIMAGNIEHNFFDAFLLGVKWGEEKRNES